MIFQPPTASYSDNGDILKLKDPNGTPISAIYLKNDAASLTILYSHGNAEDIGEIRGELRRLHDLGFSVLAYDYPGYGTSGGGCSESGAIRAIDAAYAHLTGELHVPAEKIVLMGRSLGGGPSVDLAARKKVGGLILESAFMSAFRVVTVWPILPFDKFNNIGKIGKVECPKLVIHGTYDQVVPFYHGQALFEAAHEPKQFLEVPSANHNNVSGIGGKAREDAIVEFAAKLK